MQPSLIDDDKRRRPRSDFGRAGLFKGLAATRCGGSGRSFSQHQHREHVAHDTRHLPLTERRSEQRKRYALRLRSSGPRPVEKKIGRRRRGWCGAAPEGGGVMVTEAEAAVTGGGESVCGPGRCALGDGSGD